MRLGVPWAPVGFRVELYGGQAQVIVLKPLYRPVVDVCVGHTAALRQGPGIHGKTVILRRDEILPSLYLHPICPR